ncbi:MAG: lipoyl synthase [Marinilabiliales bacterium]|nr:MAG: lipoyl synthase [Marinilabiliales bacterium]
MKAKAQRLPSWLKMKFPTGYEYSRVKNLTRRHHLHTICSSGNCPNIGDCWSRGTATFMILGDVCTRNCKFCGVKSGKPEPPDRGEPARIAESIRLLGLRHCVVTSVDRDDLPDLGAGIWAETIRCIKEVNPETGIEVLIPDFNADHSLIKQVTDMRPDVVSHNLETVRRLTPVIRSRARYETSLEVIRFVASQGVRSKSGIMLGLGETREEVLETMDDLVSAGCEIMTIGQYLAPTAGHMPVADYIRPEVFEEYRLIGLEKGFSFVESSPLVRSSWQADRHARSTENVNNSKYVKKSNLPGPRVR